MAWRGVIREYWDRMPIKDDKSVVTLLEGGTPLIPAVRLQEKLGKKVKIFFKFEGLNPTGSFKDRGMTLAVSKAVEQGSNAVICASTGNTSASAAAYAARAGIDAFVLIPEGKIARGKLSQAIVVGAKVIQIEGNFDQALKIVREISEKYPITMVNSLNPYRIEGQKTASFEICDALGEAPDVHFLPVGNAGNITAYWKGYCEYFKDEVIRKRPRMCGFQAAGSAPIVLGKPVTNPETIATAIRIGNPASWKQAEAARDESHGVIDMVTDDEILDAYRFLADSEGLFCEPASAAGVAGAIKRPELIENGQTVVFTLTGHGLKDPDTAINSRPSGTVTVPPELETVKKLLGF